MLQLLASHQGLLRIIILFYNYYLYKFELFCLIQELQSVSVSVSIIYVKVDICLGLVIRNQCVDVQMFLSMDQ